MQFGLENCQGTDGSVQADICNGYLSCMQRHKWPLKQALERPGRERCLPGQTEGPSPCPAVSEPGPLRALLGGLEAAAELGRRACVCESAKGLVGGKSGF